MGATGVDVMRPRASRVKVWIALSGVFLLGQIWSTEYGVETMGQRWFWLVVGIGLLWLVAERRSILARAFVVVTSFVGAALYVAADPDGLRAWTMAFLFLGQAIPLLTPAVRAHVSGRRGDVTRPDVRARPVA